MPDAFFVSSKTRKRKRTTTRPEGANKRATINGKGRPTGTKAPSQPAKKRRDEDLESDATQDDDLGGIDDMDLRGSDVDPGASGEEDETETPAEKRLRLAKLYLEEIKEGIAAGGDYDAAEIDKEIIASRLRQDVQEHSGKLYRFIADSLNTISCPRPLRLRQHKVPTCAVLTPDGHHLFAAGKDGSISKWDIYKKKLLCTAKKIRPEAIPSGSKKGKERARLSLDVQGHTDEIYALAVSDDGKYLVSGGKDRKVVVWDAKGKELLWVKSFGGHKDSISGLAFRKGTQQLYTASFDRMIKLFDLTAMGYVETLFGHQDSIIDIDALRNETTVSAGGRDRTVRYWKVLDETQLVFRGGGRSAIRDVLEGGLEGLNEDEDGEMKKEGKGKDTGKKFIEGSIDCVAMVDESTFVSGGDSGSLCVWTTQKKKPQFTQALAHGLHEVISATEGIVSTPRWITALASLQFSDVIASGSWSGDVRLWKIDMKNRSLSQIGSLPAPGIVNSLQLISISTPTAIALWWNESNTSHVVVPTETPSTHVNGHEPSLAASKSKSKPDEARRTPPPSSVNSGQSDSLMVVASTAQEPRFSRWLRLKESAASGTRVYVVHPRETSS